MVAIVGSSGSGKSTLVSLIPRFFDRISGKILIDDIDINNLSRLKIRSLIGIVSQDSILFNTSIKENILLGDQKGNIQEKLSESISIANAEEFINEFDDQVDHNVGDNGSNLSGGQKQRVAIARAVYSNSPILLSLIHI